MDKTICILVLCAVSCCTALEMTILGARQQVLRQGQSRTLTCQLNQGLEVILAYKVHWLHQPLTTDNAPEVTLTDQQSLHAGVPPEHYAVEVKYDSSTTNVTLTIKDAMAAMDGRYICRAIPTKPDGGETLTKEMEVLFPSDVQSIQLVFDGEEVSDVTDMVVQREEGEYAVTCRAAGFNPGAILELYLGDQILPAEVDKRRDTAAARQADARRFQASVTMESLNLMAAHSGQTLKCKALAEFQGSQEMVASMPLKIIALEPEITCDKNASAHVNDKYVKLKCHVHHATVDVDRYSFEIGDTGEIIESEDGLPPNFHKMFVKKVDDHRDNVTLELYQAEVMHFNTVYYLDVFLTNGQRFRHKATIIKLGDGTGAASKPTSFVLYLLLLALLAWRL